MDTNGHPVSAASGEPVWLSILLDMGRNPFYADQQIIPIVNDGTWKAVAEYVSSLRTERDATERLCEQHEGKIHELRDLLAFAESALSGGLAENESLRARLAACERVVAAATEWAYRRRETRSYATDILISADELERAVIAHRAAVATAQKDTDDDFGPNDGHARTVNRSAWQEGKV